MNYYSFHIGDYVTATVHLEPLEDLAYRRLLDMYYDTEQPIPLETHRVSRRLRLDTEIVDSVLKEFFTLTDSGWVNGRCDADIAAYHRKADANRSNGKQGGRPKKTQPVNLANPNESQPNLNQEPRTNNQEPITTNQEPSKEQKPATATRLPADWHPSEADIEFCKTNRPDLQHAVVREAFRDYWIAVPGAKGRKADWSATWRNWVRKETAASQTKGGGQFLTAQQQRDENNRRSTEEFLSDDAPIFGYHGEPIEGECSNA